MDTNEHDSVQPAYENGPKEVNVKHKMPSSKRQFGEGYIEQNNKPMRHPKAGKSGVHQSRHKEHR
jgi:hypothetical protein